MRIGALAMVGDGRNIWTLLNLDNGNPGVMQDTHYTRVGLFASLMLGDLNLFGTAIHGSDTLETRDATATMVLSSTPYTYDSWFAQADYVLSPAFILSARYEKLRLADASAEPKGARFTDLCLTYAVAANLKLQLEARKDANQVMPTNSMVEAVVYVAALPGKSIPAPREHAKMKQKNLVFTPHVLPVLVGTTVDFKNSDAVLHNVFSPDACCDKFNLGTWPQGQSKSQTFETFYRDPAIPDDPFAGQPREPEEGKRLYDTKGFRACHILGGSGGYYGPPLIFRHYCSTCHGETGAGDGFNAFNVDPRPRDFSNPEFQKAKKDEDLADAIRRGGAGVGLSPLMPPWGHTLTPVQIDQVVRYLRTLGKEGA